MNERDVFAKTEAGREEMRTRALHLAGSLRSTLLLVDGHRDVSQLKELITGSKAPPDALDQLLVMGLIEMTVPVVRAPVPAPVPASAPRASQVPPPAPPSAAQAESTEQFNRLYTLMNEIVSDYLGLRGYFMQLKIEKCSNANDLLDLEEELRAAISKAHGQDVANELIGRIRAAV